MLPLPSRSLLPRHWVRSPGLMTRRRPRFSTRPSRPWAAQEKLGKAEIISEKAKGKLTIEGNENSITSEGITQGIDHHRSEFEGEFNGNKFKGLSVLNGDKGWRMFGDMVMEMDQDAVKNEKRSVYLWSSPTTILPLKGKGFKVESAPDEKVGGKPAAGIKGTGPDGKDFTLYFDKDSGLPVRHGGQGGRLDGRRVHPGCASTATTRTSTASRRPPRSRSSATATRSGAGDHRVQGPRQGARRHLRRAEVSEAQPGSRLSLIAGLTPARL